LGQVEQKSSFNLSEFLLRDRPGENNGNSKPVLDIDQIGRSKSSRCNFGNQTRSLADVLGQVSLLTFRTERKIVSTKMSYGFYLAEEVCARGQECIKNPTLMDELQGIIAENTNSYDETWEASGERSSVERKISSNSVFITAEGSVHRLSFMSPNKTEVDTNRSQYYSESFSHGKCRYSG